MVCSTPGDGVQTTPSAASGQRGATQSCWTILEASGEAQGSLASGDFLAYNAHPRREPWQNRLQIQLWALWRLQTPSPPLPHQTLS